MQQSMSGRDGSTLPVGAFPLGVSAPWQDKFGRWFVTRMDDVQTVLTDDGTQVDQTLSRQVSRVTAALGTQFVHLPLLFNMTNMTNGAKHARHRELIADLVREMPAKMPKQDIPAHIQNLLGADGDVDIIHALINPVLDRWRENMFGIRPEQSRAICNSAEALLERASQGLLLGGPSSLDQNAAVVLHGYQRAMRSTDKPLGDPDYVVILLAFVALEALQGFCANIVELLADDISLQDMLRVEPAKMAPFLVEAERLCGSGRYLQREIGPAGLTLGDVDLPPGARVVVDLRSANRDPSIWENPESFDLNRPRHPNVAFAAGPHRCMGIQATRVFLPLFLKNLLETCRLHPGKSAPRRSGNWVMDQAVELPLYVERIAPSSKATACQT